MASSAKRQVSVRGTRIRGGVYYLNLRVPPELRDAHNGRTHLVQSLGTRDPREAERKVIQKRAELFKAVDAQQNEAAITTAVEQLPPTYQEILRECGGLEGLIEKYESSMKSLKRLQEPEEETYEPQTAHEIWIEQQAQDELNRFIEHDKHNACVTGRVLNHLGKNVEIPGDPIGLLEISEYYISAKGVPNQTADAYRYVTRRFFELHGNVSLDELNMAHLRDYANMVLKLPKVTSSNKLREADFKAAIEIAEANKLPRVSETTQERHVSMLKTLVSFATTQGYMKSEDPWSSYKILRKKNKHSAQKRRRQPFNTSDIQNILRLAETFNPVTIDRWAPLLACYQGARREEIGQLRGADIFQKGGVWCISITDEGEHQKVKNASSFRVIPLHTKVLHAGFIDFVENRIDKDVLFYEMPRWKGKPRPLSPDPRGRLTEAYGKRFSRLLRTKLGIDSKALVFHSFRHAWEDAADAANMQQSHRRALAGRSAHGDSQAAYGAGPTMAALLESLSKIDPAAG